jgi:hypothetical protein
MFTVEPFKASMVPPVSYIAVGRDVLDYDQKRLFDGRYQALFQPVQTSRQVSTGHPRAPTCSAWTFPARLVQGQSWIPTAVILGTAAGLVALDPTEALLGQDAVNAGRPNLAAGVPVWINDPGVAGGRRLNPATFSLPPAGAQGTLGRNAIYGNGMTQLDLSLHRALQSFRGTSMEIGFNIYNVLNHPAFGDPVPFLSSPLFGQSTSMQNLMLGSGTPNTGLPSLFQTGGPRSAQLGVRFSF